MQIVARGVPILANRVLALVRRLFNWAISRDLLEHNPCLQVRAPGKEHPRERVLSAEEIRPYGPPSRRSRWCGKST